MKIRSLLLTFLLLFCVSLTEAQNELDAYRYSGTSITGTARAIGMGGAFSAVGADFTAASLNPAGLGLYRKSDLMFTPRLRFTNTDVSYLDVNEADLRTRFGFANVGYVFASRLERWNRETKMREEADRGLKSYAFSIGFNQLANYSRNTSVSAFNTENSITDHFAALANGTSAADIGSSGTIPGMAWNAWLIDTSVVDGQYVGAALGGNMRQNINVREWGRNNEWTVGFAGNIDDFIYIGASLGIQDIRYNHETSLLETDENNVHQSWANDSTPLNSARYTDIYTTRGNGFNLRVGLIARPMDFLRVGLSVQTPTWMALQDNYSTEISGTLDPDPNDEIGDAAREGVFTYRLTTPFKANAGLMFLVGKMGFLTADFEYVDYTGSAFRSDVGPASPFYYNFVTENQAIQDLFQATYNFRLGGEFRMGPARFRAGYANFGAILNQDARAYFDYASGLADELPGSRHVFTGGLGYKRKSYYIDFAYARELNSERRLFYTVADVNAYSPELISRITSSNFYMTIGFTF
ncbi:MAG: hypothetical protein AAF570_01755 [Bacteroidota bacterium]